MASETEKPHLALLLRLEQSLGRAVGSEYQVRIVFIDHLVDLPYVQMIGLQARERFLKLAHGDVLVAPMRAHFRHYHGSIPLALECAAEPFLTQAAMIFPGIVEE